MNSSQFMDKQIMDLSGSKNDDFLELLKSQEEQNNGGKREEIFPSYDFQQIRPVGVSQSTNLENNKSNVGVWKSGNSKTSTSSVNNYGSLDPDESVNVTWEKDPKVCDAAMLSEIDQTMKKHADDLLHALEGVSARLSQLESRSHHLESSVDDLKVAVEYNHGSTDGKLRKLENVLIEVQTGVKVLRDKQEIAEAQVQLATLQTPKGDQQSENQNSMVHTDSVQQAGSSPQQFYPLPSVALPQPPQSLPTLAHASPPPPSQNPPSVLLPTQLPQSQGPSIPQREPYFPPPGQPSEPMHQQFQLPPSQLPQPSPQAPHQHYQPVTQLPNYTQLPQPLQQQPPHGPVHPSPQPQPPLGHHAEEIPYMPAQSYPPSIRQPPSMSQQPSGAPPSQQFYGAPPYVYEPPLSKPSSGYSQGYGPPPGSNFSDSYPYTGSPSQYSSSTMKPPQLSSSPSAPSSGSSYPRLPTAQILPHALPTATSVNGGSNSSGTGNRVPIDDVVDKVTTMGFSRDQVRATVRKLTENGQSVDLNVVLDKLMNDGEVIQPQRGWFGR